MSATGDEVNAQPIVIQVGLAPELTVSTPTEGQLYRAGDTITYNAFARDAAGFDLDDGDIKTEVRLHHGSHFHPFVGPLTGRAGSFTIPTTGEASADTSYEVKVTATDSNGLSASKIVNIFPRKSELTVGTEPAGLGVSVDGVPVSTPRTFTGVEGFQRELVAPNSAVATDGTPLQFAGWSDGKSIRHMITTPEDDTTYTATYRPSQPFTARYYDNTTFSGAPVLTRQDPNINFAWGEGAPDPALPANNFAVRLVFGHALLEALDEFDVLLGHGTSGAPRGRVWATLARARGRCPRSASWGATAGEPPRVLTVRFAP